ncbi:MAG: PAS domain-containing sensor histidine kinase [Candidatus Krumholzibacteria bacterium]|nr:PAS domain-containing sensor histidine kinase [Candidatus Krumholzibacteria bacterium]MDH4336345.1 PAS domain-containing sensor histidine kinase [Candidatus Krumholzibacteria bacterium]MDH5270505.1 PAS domain-containing sensor histidine kinase [Candidatus Krumholzibacteria bacterium]
MDDINLHALVLDALRDPVMVVDGSGEVLLANPAAMRVLELARADGGGNGHAALDGAAIMDLVRRAERVRVDAVPVPGDASQVIDVEALPGCDPGAQRCWMLRIRAADALEREFWSDSAVATVAHEIRNPITAMLNALGALSAPEPAGTRVGGGGSMARGAFERSTRRLARLVDGLLDLSRVRTGALHLQRSPLSVADFVQRIVADFRVLHPATGDRLTVGPIEPGMTIYVDEDRAEQSLWNLLSNAVRFTPRTQTVTVRVAAAGVESMEDALRLVPWDVIGHPQLVRIDVEDTGLGMTPDTLEHIFDRHHAAGNSTDGAHLGLSITRALVDAHDGWVSVDSRLGEGTTVSMFVPEDAASATLLSGVRLAEREIARRRAVHRSTAIAVLQRTGGASWSQLVSRLPRTVKLQPQEPVSPRECAVWALSADLAVALVPLAASGEPSETLGDAVHVVEDGAWEMDGFIAGWCGEREPSFAQAFHRAATKMIRARHEAAGGEEAVTAAVNAPGTVEPAPDGERG